MAERIAYQEGGVNLAVAKELIVQLPPSVLRARLTGLLFETNKCFLLPAGVPGLRRLNDLIDETRKPQLLITGHTDRVFTPQFNLELSEERAAAMSAYLRDDVEAWIVKYDPSIHEKKRWGAREDQHMLSELGFFKGPVTGTDDDAYREAVGNFQDKNGLVADRKPGPKTRRALIEAYMKQPGTTLPAGTVVQTHGCGESHPEVETPDETEEPRNRRVEVFLFSEKIDPPPRKKCPDGGCPEYAKWKGAAKRTIDLSEPPRPLILAFGLTDDPTTERASATFETRAIHVEREETFALPFVVKDATKVVLTDPDGKTLDVTPDPAPNLGGPQRGTTPPLREKGKRFADDSRVFKLTAFGAGGKKGPTDSAVVNVHDTLWLDRKVFGLGPTDPVPPEKRVVYGFDASYVPTDFKKVARAGHSHGRRIGFVMMEISGFASFPPKDPNDRFRKVRDENFRKLRQDAPNLIFGFWHFFTNDPVDRQVDNFLTEFNKLRGSNSLSGMLPPVIDIETKENPPVKATPDHLEKAREFMDKVKAALDPKGIEPIVYTNEELWLTFTARARDKSFAKRFAKSPLWVVSVNTWPNGNMPDATLPKLPLPKGQKRAPGTAGLPDGGWTQWTFWQFHFNGEARTPLIPGVGKADHDVFFGTIDALKALVVK